MGRMGAQYDRRPTYSAGMSTRRPSPLGGRRPSRHELTDFLLEQGGHIGYSIRPSARRQGHASAALRQVLELAAEMGHERVLLTCDEDNIASRAIIEGVGGEYEDSRVGTRRYWVPTLVTDRPAGALIG